MAEPQVKDLEKDVTIMSYRLQDVESLQTAIEVIVHEKDTQRSLAQLYPVLDASPFTPALVCPIIFIHVAGTDVWYAGSSRRHAAPDTVPLCPCRPRDQACLGKGERQRDPACSTRDLGTFGPRWRTRRRRGARGEI